MLPSYENVGQKTYASILWRRKHFLNGCNRCHVALCGSRDYVRRSNDEHVRR